MLMQKKKETGLFSKHSDGNTKTDFYNLKFSWKLDKCATKHVLKVFSIKPTGFEIFWKVF